MAVLRTRLHRSRHCLVRAGHEERLTTTKPPLFGQGRAWRTPDDNEAAIVWSGQSMKNSWRQRSRHCLVRAEHEERLTTTKPPLFGQGRARRTPDDNEAATVWSAQGMKNAWRQWSRHCMVRAGHEERLPTMNDARCWIAWQLFPLPSSSEGLWTGWEWQGAWQSPCLYRGWRCKWNFLSVLWFDTASEF
jgi:hypothetical protein